MRRVNESSEERYLTHFVDLHRWAEGGYAGKSTWIPGWIELYTRSWPLDLDALVDPPRAYSSIVYLISFQLTSVFVDDQESALKFYTDVLGFVKKQDFPVGQFKWLTVVSPEEPDGPKLLLETSDNPAVRPYKESTYQKGIAAAPFAVNDIQREYERLKQLGVDFKMEPTDLGATEAALFDDTFGNLIQVYEAS